MFLNLTVLVTSRKRFSDLGLGFDFSVLRDPIVVFFKEIFF